MTWCLILAGHNPVIGMTKTDVYITLEIMEHIHICYIHCCRILSRVWHRDPSMLLPCKGPIRNTHPVPLGVGDPTAVCRMALFAISDQSISLDDQRWWCRNVQGEWRSVCNLQDDLHSTWVNLWVTLQGVYYLKYRREILSNTNHLQPPRDGFLNPLLTFWLPQTHRHIAQTLEGSWLCFAQHKSVGGLYWSLYESKAPDELVVVKIYRDQKPSWTTEILITAAITINGHF